MIWGSIRVSAGWTAYCRTLCCKKHYLIGNSHLVKDVSPINDVSHNSLFKEPNWIFVFPVAEILPLWLFTIRDKAKPAVLIPWKIFYTSTPSMIWFSRTIHFKLSLTNSLSLQTLQLTKQSKLSYTICAKYFRQHLCVKCLIKQVLSGKRESFQG